MPPSRKGKLLNPSSPIQQDAQLTMSPLEDDTSSWTEPPWVGFLETTEDALLVLEAARRRLIPRVTRRLADRERRLIHSGSVFVFEEEESGIKRWTDGYLWSPSRILGNFLLYRETDKRSSTSQVPQPTRPASSLLVPEGPTVMSSGGYSAAGTSGMDRARERILLGSLTNSHKFKEDGMMKKTFSLTLADSNKTHHLVSYYKVADVEAGRLRTPSSLPEFAALEISPDFLDKTHFRVQPRVEVGEDGRVRFRGETMETIDESNQSSQSQSSEPSPPTHHTHAHPHTHAAHPYHPRPSHSRQHSLSSTTTATTNGGFFQAGVSNGHSPGSTVFSPSQSPSISSHSSHHSHHSHSHSPSRQRAYTSPTPVAYDNSTGAPPFQAPQLYDPLQPSASANAMHGMMTYGSIPSYPPSLAPSVRSGGSGCLYEESVGSLTYSSSSSGASSVLCTPSRRSPDDIGVGVGKLMKAEQQQVLGEALWDIPYTFVESPVAYFAAGGGGGGFEIPPPQTQQAKVQPQSQYWQQGYGVQVQDHSGMCWGTTGYE